MQPTVTFTLTGEDIDVVLDALASYAEFLDNAAEQLRPTGDDEAVEDTQRRADAASRLSVDLAFDAARQVRDALPGTSSASR